MPSADTRPEPHSSERFAGVLTRRRVVWAVLLLLVVSVLVFAWQAFRAAGALFDARNRANSVELALTHGDFDAATVQLDEMRTDTGRAAEATDGILWDLGRHLPAIGETIGAVQTTASVVHRVTTDNAPIALRLSEAVTQGSLRPKDGRIDLAAILALTTDVRRAADSIRGQEERLAAVDTSAVLFPFDQVVRELTGQVERAAGAALATDTAFTLLPQMLGGQEPRTYLLMIQNTAEIRSTGGIPGSIAILHADKGHVRMGTQGSARDVGGFPRPVPGMSESAAQVYGPTLQTDFRDITFNPDFPEVAATAARMIERSQGIEVDGVVSIDPVVLALMLRGTGPVDVTVNGRTAQLNHANAVTVLLNTAYQVLPSQELQDEFFEESARALFDTVLAGKGNERVTITGMATGASQRRVLVWSRHEAEQARLAGTAVAGALPESKDQPHVGLYLNDATAGKPEFYLDYQPALSARRCLSGGRQELQASVALVSNMPKDHHRLSYWITGTGQYAPKGTIAVNLRIYSPKGGTVTEVRRGNETISVTADRHEDHQVAVVPLQLEPGERVVVRATMTTAQGQSGRPVLDLTPGIRLQDNGVEVTSACAD